MTNKWMIEKAVERLRDASHALSTDMGVHVSITDARSQARDYIEKAIRILVNELAIEELTR